MMIGILAWTWVTLLLVVQPLTAWLGRARLALAARPRAALYRSSAIGIGSIGLITLALDLAGGRRAFTPVTDPPFTGHALVWTFATVIAVAAFWLGIQLIRKFTGRPPSAGFLHLLPRAGLEKFGFAGVSLLAGFAEEYAIRGFCLLKLISLTGSSPAAAVLTTVAFGLGHAYQGVGGVLRTGLAGAILVVPVLMTGSLVPSMLGHAVLDLMSGLLTLPLLTAWRVVTPEQIGASV